METGCDPASAAAGAEGDEEDGAGASSLLHAARSVAAASTEARTSDLDRDLGDGVFIPQRYQRLEPALPRAPTVQVAQTPAGPAASERRFLAWATSMSRGKVTPFFTATISAMMLTAISGGVLLPT